MIEVGRLCVKLAGRDSGKKCVIVDVLDKDYVLIDGETRRRKCNIDHIEPLKDKIDIAKGASHETVKTAFKKLGIEVIDTKKKEKKEKPIRSRVAKVKQQTSSEKEPAKKENKKEKKELKK